jgi:hypothetical protein
MTVEDIILSNSIEPKAKLIIPARKAFEAPDTGVTIVKPAAYRVIKDCAETTITFLPVEIFLKYSEPVKQLKGKFTREQITDLYNRSKSNRNTELLFKCMYNTCPSSSSSEITITNIGIQSSSITDPYGDYDDAEKLSGSKNTTPGNELELVIETYC